MSSLTLREETILSSIIRQYVALAQPVSSVGILEECGLDVSSATIRNDVAHLEEEGYISRPHYAAGSIPSDRGYRHYVSTLSPSQLPMEVQFMFNHLFHQVEGKLEEWLNLAATLLARQTRSMAAVTAPRPAAARFKHMELVSLQPQLALMVLVLEGVKVHQQLINLDKIQSQEDLSQLAASLNKKLAKLSVARVRTATAKLSDIEQYVAQNVLRLMEAEDRRPGREIFLDGWQYLLSQPEFHHSARLAGLMNMVEERKLAELMSISRDPCLQIFIGHENQAEAIKECSLLISSYGLPDEPLGSVAVVGPTRMAYHHVIPVLSYIASLISMLVTELYGASPPSTRQTAS